MIKLSFDSSEIGVPCPKCGEETRRRIGDLRAQPDLDCPCGVHFRVDLQQFDRKLIESAQSFENGLKAVQASLDSA